jgi:general secretion pathway protein B
MSLILEALKKSEAERRLGQAPGLLDASPYARRRRRSPWLLVVSLGTLLAAVALAAFWLGRNEPRSLPEQAPAEPAGLAVDPQPAIPRAPDAAPVSLAGETAAESEPLAPPPKPSTALPSDPGFASVEREARALPAGTVPELLPSEPPPQSPPPRPALDSNQGAIPAPQPAPTLAPDNVTFASQPPPPLLSSLGPERRGRLPPLKVSMHVYAEDPGQRVVLIDGRRLREGDSLGEGLRLLEIRRDGSVLELDGRTYLLPRS